MRKTIFFLLCCCSWGVYANGFVPKPLDSFKSLDQWHSTEKFKTYINNYVQNCLDHSFGGSLSVRCFIQSKLWDRELNKYYQLLYQHLDKQGQSKLKASQRSWLKTQKTTIELNSYFLDQQFNNKAGTMYIALRAGEVNKRITPMIRQRALLLKAWYESLQKCKGGIIDNHQCP